VQLVQPVQPGVLAQTPQRRGQRERLPARVQRRALTAVAPYRDQPFCRRQVLTWRYTLATAPSRVTGTDAMRPGPARRVTTRTPRPSTPSRARSGHRIGTHRRSRYPCSWRSCHLPRTPATAPTCQVSPPRRCLRTTATPPPSKLLRRPQPRRFDAVHRVASALHAAGSGVFRDADRHSCANP
jgi:hypothetical protein